MKVYIVCGTTGEYSDRSEWIVAAYAREADAKEHVLRAKEYADAWLKSYQDKYIGVAVKSPLDSRFRCDYIGTDYWYEELEVKGKFTAPETVH